MFDATDGETPMLRDIRKLLPAITAAAAETEMNRSLPAHLVDQLGAAGIFRMMLPKALGGEEMDFVQSMRVAEELAYADMSAGWTVMVTCGLNLNLGQFQQATIEEILADGPDVRMRGVTAPKGRFLEADGGYRLTGQWAMASGSFEPDWVVAAGFVYDDDDDAPRVIDGAPDWRIAVIRGQEARFLDTWKTMGLCGTASHDFILDNVFVPSHHVAPMFGRSHIASPAYRLPASIGNTAHHAGARIGCASGALHDLAQLAATKRSAFVPGRILGEEPSFQLRFGELIVRLDAARSYTEAVLRQLWSVACSDRDITPADLARGRCMLAHVSTECADITTEAFRLGSSSSIYVGSSLQRRLRDIQVAAQHAAAGRGAYEGLGSAYVTQATTAKSERVAEAA